MFNNLLELSKQLKLLGFPIESHSILKVALKSRAERTLEVNKDPSYQKKIFALLKMMGLQPIIDSAVSILMSANYLKEGVTQNHLLLAGLSIIAAVPNYNDVLHFLNLPKATDPNMEIQIAKKIFQNQGMLQAKINQLKNPKIGNYLQQLIPDGQLLIIHSDQIWNAIRAWMLNTINLGKNQDLQVNQQLKQI